MDMNIVPFLLYVLATLVFMLEAVAPKARSVLLVPFGLAVFTAAVCLTFVLQPTWGHVIIH